MSSNGGGGKRRKNFARARDDVSCAGVGHPVGCGGGCCGKTAWIGDSTFMLVLFGLCFTVGTILYFLSAIVFKGFWGLGGLDSCPSINPESWTHAYAPNQTLFALWLPCVQLVGAVLLWISALILVLGGLHANGLLWWLGTSGLTVQSVLEIYSGTTAANFSIYNLDMAVWFSLAGWICIFLGVFFTFMVGMSPLPAGVYGCSAYCSRGQSIRRKLKPRAREEIGEEDFDEEGL